MVSPFIGGIYHPTRLHANEKVVPEWEYKGNISALSLLLKA
jgi:hypothetical protein